MHSPCPKLFDLEFQVNRKTQRSLTRYLGGLILYQGKKNCSAIAKASSTNHDSVYDFFKLNIEEKVILQSFLNTVFSNRSKFCIKFDDGRVANYMISSKLFAKSNERFLCVSVSPALFFLFMRIAGI